MQTRHEATQNKLQDPLFSQCEIPKPNEKRQDLGFYELRVYNFTQQETILASNNFLCSGDCQL